MVYFLRGEGKMADVDEKVDDVVLADLPVVVLLPLLVVIHHPLQQLRLTLRRVVLVGFTFSEFHLTGSSLLSIRHLSGVMDW